MPTPLLWYGSIALAASFLFAVRWSDDIITAKHDKGLFYCVAVVLLAALWPLFICAGFGAIFASMIDKHTNKEV